MKSKVKQAKKMMKLAQKANNSSLEKIWKEILKERKAA